MKIDEASSVSDGILFHYYRHFRSGPEQTAVVQRLSTRSLSIRKCGRCSHRTREQRRMLNVDELFSVSSMLFLKRRIYRLIAYCVQQQKTKNKKKNQNLSEQVKQNAGRELDVSSSLSAATFRSRISQVCFCRVSLTIPQKFHPS